MFYAILATQIFELQCSIFFGLNKLFCMYFQYCPIFFGKSSHMLAHSTNMCASGPPHDLVWAWLSRAEIFEI